MPYLTFDNLLDWLLPDPLAKDVEIKQLGGSVHIQGVVTRDDLKAINDEIEHYRQSIAEKKLAIQHPKTGKTFHPTFSDAVAACWLAKCVTEPSLTAFQWLQFSGEGFKFLPILFNECLICSRQEEDKEADIPTGVDAAEKELESGSPLESDATP